MKCFNGFLPSALVGERSMMVVRGDDAVGGPAVVGKTALRKLAK